MIGEQLSTEKHGKTDYNSAKSLLITLLETDWSTTDFGDL